MEDYNDIYGINDEDAESVADEKSCCFKLFWARVCAFFRNLKKKTPKTEATEEEAVEAEAAEEQATEEEAVEAEATEAEATEEEAVEAEAVEAEVTEEEAPVEEADEAEVLPVSE